MCPGLFDTGASRPWLDVSRAIPVEQSASALLDLALAARPDPSCYGELVRFGKIVPWRP